MSQVIVKLTMTADGGPINPGDLMVLHVDRRDVVCPPGWTENAAKGATGKFFWRIASSREPTAITLSSPTPERFAVDAMSLWMRI